MSNMMHLIPHCATPRLWWRLQALASETVDSKVLNLAREDIVWHSVSELITDVPDKTLLGLNIVEFCGDDEALIDGQVGITVNARIH